MQSKNKKRSRIDLIADILRATNKSLKKSHIVYRTEMSFQCCTKYLNFLEDKRLVELDGKRYVVTPNGYNFLQKYRELKQLLGDPKP